MSTRSTRKKSAPPKMLELEEETSPSRPARRKIQKPKYVMDAERSSTPSSSRSRLSSPDSIASSPARTKSVRSSHKKTGKTPKGTKGSKPGTPVGSRASSVTSSTKKKKGKSPAKPKLKTKLGRGYNPNLVNYKDSEYHYGSDFENDDEFVEPDSANSSESEESDVEDESDDMKPESDVETDPIIAERDSFTPVPFWLQDYAEIPELTLPPSSEDLCVDQELALPVVSIYEVLRQFRNIVRLSPFRLEDFAVSMSSDDQSNLLSEIHIALLKCLLREDEYQQIQYGPLDQKDSMNVFLHFYDSVTWPENLKFYLSNDPVGNKAPLEVMNTTEYPFTTLANKVLVLQHLTSSMLATAAVRDDLINEGHLPLEDHCRVCHRLGDMVVCEHCNGPFHGTCLVPPLYDVPEEEWICPVCADHMVEGVFDCIVASPGAARHVNLGVDRRGAKYWFVARRLWVESMEGEGSYYSTKEQLEELMECLDRVLYERELVDKLVEMREEMEQHMEITVRLTQQYKGMLRRSYLDMENSALAKVQGERKTVREKEELERRKAQEEVDKVIREEEDSRRINEEQTKHDELEKKRRIREDRMEERMKKRGDAFQDSDLFDGVDEDPILEEVATNEETIGEEIVAEETIGEEIVTSVTEVTSITTTVTTRTTTNTQPIIIQKPEIPAGNYFKLGQEGTYKQYVNQYTAVTHALSRNQSKEELEKRTRLSHKFSLTDASTFKWQGSEDGTRATLVSTVRSTILQLEQNIPTSFMHTNWAMLRRPWMSAVQASSNPGKDFSRALTVLVCCIKPCILLPVWTDSLGHTNIKRIQAQAKEEKKKLDKKEKKEREDEEERLKPWMTWVKYTLPVKSLTVVRQKGEEYRAHGRNGWLWLSTTRVVKHVDSTKLGLRAGAHRIAVKYTELKTNTNKVVLMEPKAFAFLMRVQKERDDKALARMVTGEDEVEEEDISKEKTDEEKKKESLKKILDMSRIDMQEANDEDLGGPDGVVDICGGLINPARLLYPRSAKKSQLDDLLARRIQLRNWEEKKIEVQGKAKDEPGVASEEGEKDTKTVITSDMVDKVPDNDNLEAWISNSKKKLFDAVKVIRDNLKPGNSFTPCYSPLCAAGDPSQCYSPTCTAKQDMEGLVGAAEIYKHVIKEGKMREVLKVDLLDNFRFSNNKEATVALTNVVKMLLVKEREVSEQPMQGISTVTKTETVSTTTTTTSIMGEVKAKSEVTTSIKSETKTEDDVTEIKTSFESQSVKSEATDTKPVLNRCYSVETTSGSLYLKRIQSVADSKKTSRIVKYPLAPSFWGCSRQKRSILVINKHDLKKLARNFGQTSVEGFNYAAKANPSAWPYPCPRPLFRTSWLYRTAGMTSLHSVAMQLRILWMCVRWDDMITKPPTSDGKNQLTTDNEIVTTEILKHRNIGRYLEMTQYWQRKISIPLDQPRKQVDYSPIRSGLRKRKRAESPVSADPRVEEVWVDELALELWEIKGYRDRVDRDREKTTFATTRRQAGTMIRAPEKYDPSEERRVRMGSSSLQEIKQKTEESLREQRAAFKAGRSATPEMMKPNVSGLGGGIKLMGSRSMSGGLAGSTAKKIFISKDGKIIGHQVAGGGAPPGKVAIPSLANKAAGPALAAGGGSQQKVQIVKSADGKIQVRGLLPGQQLVQMPDGKLQIFSSQQNTSNTGSPVKPGQVQGAKVLGESSVIQSPQPATPPVKLLPNQQPSLLPKPAPGMVTSPSKTYCIQRNPNVPSVPNTPIQPKLQPIQPLPTTPQQTGQLAPSQAATPSTPKQSKVVGIQSLGSNTVTIKDGQLIVQGPDHAAATAIARQLSTGQAKLGNVGGKQVLVIIAPDEPAPPPEPPKEPTPPPREPTPPPPPITVTAQLVQTPQGPRIILQGLQGVQLEQQQLVTIQQQVKQQLLKQQALARQQGKVPPTKVSIQLSGNIGQKKLDLHPSEAVTSTTTQEAAAAQQTQQLVQEQQQLLAQQPNQQLATQQLATQQQNTNNFLDQQVQPPPIPQYTHSQPPSLISPQPSPLLSSPPTSILSQQLTAPQNNTPTSLARAGPSNPPTPTLTNLPASVIKQGHFVIKDGKKVLVLPQNVLAQHQATIARQTLGQTEQTQQTQPSPQSQSLLLNSLTSPTRAEQLLSPGKSLLSPTAGPEAEGDKFELTEDYIQQTIKNALKGGNLTPELQEKLMSQLDGSDMADVSKKSKPNLCLKKGKKTIKSNMIDPASGEPMDDEWQPLSWQKNKIQNQVRKKSETDPKSDTESDFDPSDNKSPPIRVLKKLAPVEDKKRISVQNRLSSMLFKQKEQLKKDIAKKRALLEKELSLEITKEVESLKQQAQNKLNSQKSLQRKRTISEVQSPQTSPLAAATRKRRKSDKMLAQSPSDDSSDNIPGIKKDRMYCVCKSRYDPAKFYVGCDICSNWFHGSCVGITPKMSKKMSEYVCEECRSAKENDEIYCLCRQPYDDSQFYIGCEKCSDWFHGRCVGILQAEAESIEEYVCPRCEPNSKLNYPNLKKLNSKDHELIKKTFKIIQTNRNSQPFREPVDPNVNPKYYEIVKEPMGMLGSIF